MKLSIDFRTEAAVGQQRSGDAVVVRQADEVALVAVIDVLGHGSSAADVADLARAHLEQVELTSDARDLMMSLHEALRGTRGAAATLCTLQGSKVSGCGVGNVELRSQGTSVPIFLNPGILGQRVRQTRVFEADVRAGDRLVWFSDGISSRVDLDQVRHLEPREACRSVFDQHRKRHDDASIAIADIVAVARPGRDSTAPRARERAREEIA